MYGPKFVEFFGTLGWKVEFFGKFYKVRMNRHEHNMITRKSNRHSVLNFNFTVILISRDVMNFNYL